MYFRNLLGNHINQGTAVVVQVNLLTILDQLAALVAFTLVTEILVIAGAVHHLNLTIVIQKLIKTLVFRRLCGAESILRHLLEHGKRFIAALSLVVDPNAAAAKILDSVMEVCFIGRVSSTAVDRDQAIRIVAVVSTF